MLFVSDSFAFFLAFFALALSFLYCCRFISLICDDYYHAHFSSASYYAAYDILFTPMPLYELATFLGPQSLSCRRMYFFNCVATPIIFIILIGSTTIPWMEGFPILLSGFRLGFVLAFALFATALLDYYCRSQCGIQLEIGIFYEPVSL